MATAQLPLPISPVRFAALVREALHLLPEAMRTTRAVLLIVAICLQESALAHRWQISDPARPNRKGPARGLPQFELGAKGTGAGVWGIYEHAASRYWLKQVCAARKVEFTPRAIWLALETDDVLAICCARLLLFTDARPLPPEGAMNDGWRYYKRNWNPGKPKPAKWPGNYQTALDALKGSV